MRAEVLFGEVASLFRDDFNMRYLQMCVPGSELVYTDLFAEPRFVTEDVDVVYLGPMRDKHEGLVVSQLMPYRERIRELVEGGTVFLAVGNGLEVFGHDIDGEPALGIFDYRATHDFDHFERSCVLATWDDMRVVGYKTTFSEIRGNTHPWLTVDKGVGQPDDPAHEGIHYRNFFGTYLMGPALITNPPLAKYLLRLLGQSDKLAFEDAVWRSYNVRVEEYERKDIGVYVHM